MIFKDKEKNIRRLGSHILIGQSSTDKIQTLSKIRAVDKKIIINTGGFLLAATIFISLAVFFTFSVISKLIKRRNGIESALGLILESIEDAVSCCLDDDHAEEIFRHINEKLYIHGKEMALQKRNRDKVQNERELIINIFRYVEFKLGKPRLKEKFYQYIKYSLKSEINGKKSVRDGLFLILDSTPYEPLVKQLQKESIKN